MVVLGLVVRFLSLAVTGFSLLFKHCFNSNQDYQKQRLELKAMSDSKLHV